MSKADLAVATVIRRIQTDPRVAYYIAPGTATFEVLTDAYAADNGLDVTQYRTDLAASLRYEAPPQCSACERE